MIYTDPFELIKSLPPGSAVYGRGGETPETLETCILIREDERQIRKIPQNPIIELRSGMWEDRICPVVVMVLLAGLPYETWWNYHQQPQGKAEIYFNDLIRQKMIPILIYDDRRQRRSVAVRNSLADSFKKYKEIISQKPAWTMKEFDSAKERLCSQYPSVTALWEALGDDFSQT